MRDAIINITGKLIRLSDDGRVVDFVADIEVDGEERQLSGITEAEAEKLKPLLDESVTLIVVPTANLAPGCGCHDQVNAQLEKANTKIKPYYVLDSGFSGMPWPIETVQIETGRGKPKASALFASYCPFCGKPTHKAKAQEVSHG